MAEETADPVTCTIEDGVAVLRLDDGKVNVVSHRAIELLHAGLDRALDEASAVAIVGRAGKLSAGFDLTEMTAGPDRAAEQVSHPHVLVTGTPFVDVWAAVRPVVAGIPAWPEVPRGVPWKAGVLEALGVDVAPGAFWRSLLGRVSTYRDLEPALVGAVEQLIDFVTEEPAA